MAMTRITCQRCALGTIWTEDPSWFLRSACHDPRGCRAVIVSGGYIQKRAFIPNETPASLARHLDEAAEKSRSAPDRS